MSAKPRPCPDWVYALIGNYQCGVGCSPIMPEILLIEKGGLWEGAKIVYSCKDFCAIGVEMRFLTYNNKRSKAWVEKDANWIYTHTHDEERVTFFAKAWFITVEKTVTLPNIPDTYFVTSYGRPLVFEKSVASSVRLF